MFAVPPPEKTLPHEILIYGAGKILKPAASWYWRYRCGGPVRAVLKLAGVTDVLASPLVADNAMNIVKAVAAGLQKCKILKRGCQASWHVVADLYGWKEKN